MTIQDLAQSWYLALTLERTTRAAMYAELCEYAAGAESEVGDDGVPRCYLSGTEDTSDWCEPCRRRDRLYAELRLQKKDTKRLLKKLERAARTPR